MTTLYEFACGYTKAGIATVPSSAPVITIIDSANNLLISAQAATALTNLPGAYRYSYSGEDGLTCYAMFHTTDLTMDAYDLFTIAVINPAIRDIQTRLPAALTANGNMKSSVLEILATALGETGTGYLATAFRKFLDVTSPVFTTASVNQTANNDTKLTTIHTDYARRTSDYSTLTAQQVWEYVTRTITSGGITVAEVWNALMTGITTTGSVGKLIKDYLNAAVSTRATPADVQTSASVAISSTVAESVSTGSLTLQTYYTLRQTITSTMDDDLSTAAKLWLAIKSPAEDDTASIVFIEKSTGLTRVDGSAYAVTGNGALVVSGSSGAWEIDVVLDEVVTGLLNGRIGSYVAEVKALINGNALCVWSGDCQIIAGVVRAVS